METVCGERYRSGYAANDHAQFYRLAAFRDCCALKKAQNEEARTKLRARLAQNCGVLRNAGVAESVRTVDNRGFRPVGETARQVMCPRTSSSSK